MYSCQKPQSEKHSELFFRQEQQHHEYTQLYGMNQHKEKKLRFQMSQAAHLKSADAHTAS